MNLPNLASPFVDAQRLLTGPWVDFLSALAGKPGKPVTAALSGSGVPFAVAGDGHYVVQGGTVTAIVVRRGRPAVSVNMGVTQGPVPVVEGDLLAITYSVAPTVTFLPG